MTVNDLTNKGDNVFLVDPFMQIVGRYFHYFVFSIYVILIFVGAFDGGRLVYSKFEIEIGGPIIGISVFFILIGRWRVVYKIVFREKFSKIDLYLCRKKEPITLKFSEIDKVIIGTLLEFRFDKRRLFFYGGTPRKLRKFFEENQLPYEAGRI